MKKIIIILTAVMSFSVQNPIVDAAPISSIQADNFIQLISSTSQYVRVEGKICDSKISDNSKVIFLNFGKNFKTSLSAVIYNDNVVEFIDAGIDQPEKFFKDKNVVIEGVLRIFNGKPEVVINSPNQIKIVEEQKTKAFN